MNYGQVISWLNSIAVKNTASTELRLDRITCLLGLLDNPERSFKSIHVAGTSGKGSTSTFISSILSSHGFKTGLTLSPHVESINERIQLNNVPISQTDFCALANKVYPFWEQCETKFGFPTFFEVITAMAFVYFAEQKVDYAVVETGLGGELDATNVLNSEVNVITPISLDHAATLGGTIGKIALKKAGIIKPNSKTITSCSSPAFEVIQKAANDRNSRLSSLNRDFFYQIKQNDLTGLTFDYVSKEFRAFDLKSDLLGEHQALNASTAIAACGQVIELNEEKTKRGIKITYLPCRLEVVSRDPIVILDGAHNPEKAASTANFLREIFPNGIQLVIAILDRRDPVGILNHLLPVASSVFFVSPPFDKKFHDAHHLANVAKQIAPNLSIQITNLENIEQICIEPTCITGSLYLAGMAKPKLFLNSLKSLSNL